MSVEVERLRAELVEARDDLKAEAVSHRRARVLLLEARDEVARLRAAVEAARRESDYHGACQSGADDKCELCKAIAALDGGEK